MKLTRPTRGQLLKFKKEKRLLRLETFQRKAILETYDNFFILFVSHLKDVMTSYIGFNSLAFTDKDPHDENDSPLSFLQEDDTLIDSTLAVQNRDRRPSLSAIDINVDDIHHSLASVIAFEGFDRRRNIRTLDGEGAKAHLPLLFYEITASGESSYKNMTLRELLTYVNSLSTQIDEEGFSPLLSPAEEALLALSAEVSLKVPPQRKSALTRSTSVRRESLNLATANNVGQTVKRRASIAKIPQSSNSASLTRYSNNTNIPSQFQQQSYSYPQSNYNPSESNRTVAEIKRLRLRDLRRLEIQSNILNDTSVLVRRHAVIFAMDPIRAVIMADKILLVVPDGADSLISLLDQYMKGLALFLFCIYVTYLFPALLVAAGWADAQYKKIDPTTSDEVNNYLRNRRNTKLRYKMRRKSYNHSSYNDGVDDDDDDDAHGFSLSDVPFEVHAYEALLMTVSSLESQFLTFFSRRLENLLFYYKHGTLVSMEIQSEVRTLKNELVMIDKRLNGCKQALQYVVEDDEEMALMNLCLLKKKPALYR
jgi:hypothetical protein